MTGRPPAAERGPKPPPPPFVGGSEGAQKHFSPSRGLRPFPSPGAAEPPGAAPRVGSAAPLPGAEWASEASSTRDEARRDLSVELPLPSPASHFHLLRSSKPKGSWPRRPPRSRVRPHGRLAGCVGLVLASRALPSSLPRPLAEVKPRSREEVEDFHPAPSVGSLPHASSPAGFARRGERRGCGGAGWGELTPHALWVSGERRPREFFVNVELIVVN